jgi:hypothetical protein
MLWVMISLASDLSDRGHMKKALATLLAATLGLGTLTLASQPAHATVSFPAGGLSFANPAEADILSAAAVGDFFIYENVNGALTAEAEIYAKLSVIGLTNSVAPNPVFTNSVELEAGFLDPFYSAMSDGDDMTADPDPETIRVRYSKDNGATWTNGLSLTNLLSFYEFIELSEEDRLAENIRFAEWTTISLGSAPALPEDVRVEIQVDFETEGTETWPTPTTGASVNFDPIDYPEPGKLNVADRQSDDSTTDRWIRSSFLNELDDPNEARVEYKIEFFDAQDQPVVFTTLSINAYDIDAAQYVEFEDVQSYSLTQNTIIESVQQINGSTSHLRFRSMDGVYASTDPDPEEGEVHSYGEARVQVNFANVSVIYLSMGAPGSGASQQFDISAGPTWETMTGTLGPAPAPTVITEIDGAGGSSTLPVVSVVEVNPTNITVDNEIITILGANLNTVTEVYIGGIKVKIFSKSGNTLQIRAPKGLSGLVDLELKSSLNDVLMTKKLNFGGTAAVGTRKATLIVGGFAPNSRKLTSRMQARIDRWLERNSDLGTLTCTGFTSLPRRTTDVTLSTNRGLTACNFSKRQRSELETSVSQGIEDPRPGSNVRRVRLVLTP